MYALNSLGKHHLCVEDCSVGLEVGKKQLLPPQRSWGADTFMIRARSFIISFASKRKK